MNDDNDDSDDGNIDDVSSDDGSHRYIDGKAVATMVPQVTASLACANKLLPIHVLSTPVRFT